MPDLFAIHLTANGRPVAVMVPAENYLIAMATALQQYGGKVDSVRRVDRKPVAKVEQVS